MAGPHGSPASQPASPVANGDDSPGPFSPLEEAPSPPKGSGSMQSIVSPPGTPAIFSVALEMCRSGIRLYLPLACVPILLSWQKGVNDFILRFSFGGHNNSQDMHLKNK